MVVVGTVVYEEIIIRRKKWAGFSSDAMPGEGGNTQRQKLSGENNVISFVMRQMKPSLSV